MSSALLQLVPVLDGTNYTVWARSMEAFLRSQQLWRMAAGWVQFPSDPAVRAAVLAGSTPPTITEKYVKLQEEWNASNDAVIGNLMLRLSPAIADACVGKEGSDIWTYLKDTYAGSSVSFAYQQLLLALKFRLDPARHPAPQIDYLAGIFN